MRLLRLTATALLALTVLYGNGNPSCPRDGSDAWFTGKTVVPQDPPYALLFEYQCTQYMHKFWSVDAPGSVR